MNALTSALYLAEQAVRAEDREAVLFWLHRAAEASWSHSPSANWPIARAIWVMEHEPPKPRKIA